MKRLNTASIYLLAVICCSLWPSAQAAVITFDDITDSEAYGTIADGYQNFNWSSAAYVNKNTLPGTGFESGVVSGNYAALNDFAATASISGDTFDFNGAYFTAAWNDGLNIEITGLLNNLALYTQTLVVNTNGPQWFDVNFLGIDSLSFRSYGGTQNPQLSGGGEQFVMDNFTYNLPDTSIEADEPTSLILFCLGIIALFAQRQRRH